MSTSDISPTQLKKFELQGSLKKFIEIMYYARTRRFYTISDPIGRESHHLIIIAALVKVFRGQIRRLLINVPPRYGKTELIIGFISWAQSHYPDSNSIYVSYSHTLAKKQTQTIKQIIEMPIYKNLFNIALATDSQAKDNFITLSTDKNVIGGGNILAVGAQGSITGFGAGIQGISNRYAGCICIDDIIKPEEAGSDVVREAANEWYFNTLQSRVNDPSTPIIIIGQVTHEFDIFKMLQEKEPDQWTVISIPALDEADNALNPAIHDVPTLHRMKETMPFVFALQYQQQHVAAGGGLYKREWFTTQDDVEILTTFITADTAETENSFNDATVFSFWGVYEIPWLRDSGVKHRFALQWLACVELRVEPSDLQAEFMAFWTDCCRHHSPPLLAAIEKKSSGTGLISSLKRIQGMDIRDIPRSRNSPSKCDRFIKIQQYIGEQRITFPVNAKHFDMCVNHMTKITANNTHRFDDIADTVVDAVQIALIDGSLPNLKRAKIEYGQAAEKFGEAQQNLNRLMQKSHKKW